MSRPVGERSDSQRYCRDYPNELTALRTGVSIDGDSWQNRGGQQFSEEEEEAANPDQHREWKAWEEAETACTYCGLALVDAAEGSGDNYMDLPVPCPHGEFVHVSFMLERTDRLAKGYTDPRSCVVCSREGVGRRQPPHPAELPRGLPMNESEGRWAALRNIMQFADLFQRGDPGPGPDTYLTTGAYSSFELMVHIHGRSPTSTFLLCPLFGEVLGLPRAAYLDFPRPREWEEAVRSYRALFTAFGIRSQDSCSG